jgi:hypothetical protein
MGYDHFFDAVNSGRNDFDQAAARTIRGLSNT